MIRESLHRRSLQGSSFSKHLPLVALLAATSAAGILACGNDDSGDDDESTEAQALEPSDPTEVPAREEPVAPPAPPPLPPGSDTLNGLSLPAQLANWRVIGVVKVPGDPGTVRVIVGNDTAVDAARAGETNPWPDGSMMGHLQWASQPSESPGSTATVPGDFAAATLMVKNSGDYAADGGWAYGVWTTSELRPINNPTFDRACVDCHTSEVPDNDFVFTIPGALPTQAAVDGAAALSNGVELPPDILDWRVIGIASREGDANPNIRVVIGNDIAIEAARTGETNPWPDGAMLGHYVWAAGENPTQPDNVTPAAFNGITLMVKDSVEYADDGGWAYGNWATPELTGAVDPAGTTFDRACVDCHTTNVADQDFVFTVPGAIPEALFGG
jgi:cytochrome P460